MGRTNAHNLPPGLYRDQHGVYWATLEGMHAKEWRERYPDRTVPRRKAKTLKEANEKQRQLIAELREGRDVRTNNPTISELVEQWIAGRKLQSSTLRRYKQSFTWQIKPSSIGKLRVRQLTRQHIIAWISTLEQQPRYDDPSRTLDPYSIRNAFAVLRGALNSAVIDGLMSSSPARKIELPDPDDEEITPLSMAEVHSFLKLVNTADDQGRPHRNATLYHVCIRCGLRMGEVIGLRWRDIDLAHQEMTITGQVQHKVRKKGKTKKSHRTLPLSPDLVALLQAHQRNQTEERALAGPAWNVEDLVFCSMNGTPVSGLWKQFTALQRRVGLANPCSTCASTGQKQGTTCPMCHGHKTIARFRFHDLRHTYAALAIAAGVDIYTLSRRMGHESITTTADLYGHLYKGQDTDAQAIEHLLRRGAQA